MHGLVEIPARRGIAVQLARAEAIRIVNTHGHQVVDLWAFRGPDYATYLSMPHTRAVLSRLVPRAGDVLYDSERLPMLTLEEDTSAGVHDTLIAACDWERYRQLGCTEYHDNCADNMHRALLRHGVRAELCPASLNLWMNIPVRADGSLEWREPVAKAGDCVVFRAATDCIIALSACPQDILPINAGRPVCAHYELLPR